MRKITFTILFAMIAFCWQSNAQVFIQESLDTGFPTGWDQVEFTSSTNSTYLCEGTGNLYNNLFSSASNNGTLTSPNYPGISNGTDTNVTFEWLGRPYTTNAVDYIMYVEYSTDDAANWILISSFAVTETTPCTTYSEVIPAADLPDGSDFKFRIRGEWQSGDSYFYLDNLFLSQVALNPPNCDASLTETEDVSISDDISWTSATGIPTAYELTVGTTSGGSEVLPTIDVGNVTSYDLGLLDYSTLYYVSIVPKNDNGSATGCTELTFTTEAEPAAGTDCNNPIVVAALPYTTTDDTANYGDDYENGSSSCSNFYMSGDDAVYSFTPATDGNFVFTLSNIGSSYSGIHILDGCVDADPDCVGFVGNSGSADRIIEAMLTAGTTYSIVISTYATPQSTTYTLDVREGCNADAGTLTADEASVIISGATATISATEDTAPTVPADYDVTYVLTSGTDLVIEQAAATPSFDVTATGDYTIHTLVALTDPAFSADPNFLDLSVVIFGTTTAGEVLDIVSENDICAALDVAGAPINVNDGSELDFYNVQYIEETGSDPSNGSSVSFTTQIGTPLTIYAKGYEDGLTNPEGQAAGIECWIAINEENTDPASWDATIWQVATYLGDNGNDDEYSYETSETPLGTYYVAARWRLNNSGFTYGAFNGAWDGTTNVNIELIIEPLANDDCDGAQAITQETGIADAASATATPGTINGATDSGLPAETCGIFTGTANDDVWYSFEALTSDVNITFDDVATTIDLVAELYSGSCGALTFIDCADGGNPEEINATGLTVGETYYTRVFQYGVTPTTNKDITVKIWSTCTADAGTLTADATPVSLVEGTATISATANGDIVVPTDFDVTFVLTSGTDLVIEQAGAAPSFDVTAVGDYTIHTLVAETSDDTSPNYLDLSVIDFGTTTASDVLDLVSTNSLCASLDAAGAAIEVDDALSVDGQDNKAFTYFPNPVKDQLHLKAQSPIENVVIFNMLGQEVINVSPRSMEVDVNTNALVSGAYFATVTIGNTSKTIKLIKD